MTEITITQAMLIPATTVLLEVVKRVFTNSDGVLHPRMERIKHLLAVVFGVALNILFMGYSAENLIAGILIGGTAAGLYSVLKTEKDGRKYGF